MNLAKHLMGAAAFALSCFAATTQAQIPVRIMVGFPAGGDTDVVARLFAEKLAEGIRRPVVVENRTGANAQIAARAVMTSAPDGNTLMAAPEGILTLYPHTTRTAASYALKDFVPIAHLGTYYYGLVVGADVPAKNLAEWLNWTKADPRNGTYGSAGTGSAGHFLGLILAQASGVQLVNIPFRGMAPALADVVAGQVPAAVISLGALVRQAKSGRIRILAHTGSRRSWLAPEVPTFKELGYPALEESGWIGIFAPMGIRPELVARYNEILVQSQRDAAVRDRMRALDLDAEEFSPAQLAAMIKAQYERWGPVVKASGFNADNK